MRVELAPRQHDNCVSQDLQNRRPTAISLAKKHDEWERKQRFVVTEGECRNKIYKRLKVGEKPPKGSTIHYGKI